MILLNCSSSETWLQTLLWPTWLWLPPLLLQQLVRPCSPLHLPATAHSPFLIPSSRLSRSDPTMLVPTFSMKIRSSKCTQWSCTPGSRRAYSDTWAACSKVYMKPMVPMHLMRDAKSLGVHPSTHHSLVLMVLTPHSTSWVTDSLTARLWYSHVPLDLTCKSSG